MGHGSNTAALAARTAGMSDEQILDLDLDQFAAETAPAIATEIFPEAGGEPDLWRIPDMQATSLTAGRLDGQAPGTSLSPESAVMRTAFPGSTNGARGAVPPAVSSAAFGANAQGEPTWLRQLETQPGAAAEARQWREAATDLSALDAAFFQGDSSARAGLAARLYEADPGAFREMIAESARILASRDPQALAALAQQLGRAEAQAPSAPAKSLAQAARAQQPVAPQSQAAAENRAGAFPAEAYRAFESATNEDVARVTREAIERTLSSTLPDGVGEGARRRMGDDIFRELHGTLSSDPELSQRVGTILRGWNFDPATRQQVVSLIAGRARTLMPEVARRVVSEWTSSVLSSDRARAARVEAAASRRDITGGRLPEPIGASSLRPRKVDYSRMSDEQILDL